MRIDPNATLMAPGGAKKIGNKVSKDSPKVKGPELNIRDQLNDILIGEKQLIGSYQLAANEAIQPDLRNLLTNLRDTHADCHWQLFSTMYNMGEYQADLAEDAQVRDVDDVFSGYRSQIPYERDGTPVSLS